MKESWLYEDALFLRKNGKQRSCLCLLLCEVDRLANETYPNFKGGNKKRYLKFLSAKASEINLCLDKVKIPPIKGGKLTFLYEIIYKKFRCNFVHEGKDLSSEDYLTIAYNTEKKYSFSKEPNEVNMSGWVLNFGETPPFVTVDANWIIDVLLSIIESSYQGK